MQHTFVQLDIAEFRKLITDTVNHAIETAVEKKLEGDRLMSIKEASEYLGLTIHTLYKYSSQKSIPCSKKGKRILFRKSKLDEWLENDKGTKKSIDNQFFDDS